MVPHSWIKEVMEMMRITDSIMKLMLDSMQRWKTGLQYEGKQLEEVQIRRGICDGDDPNDQHCEGNKTSIHTQE